MDTVGGSDGPEAWGPKAVAERVMAINKRKDAAALFELIDKSTLKVPKNAGQLKIPSWWSSRNNPPAAAAALPEEGLGATEMAAKSAPVSPPKAPSKLPDSTAKAPESTPRAPAKPQARTADQPAVAVAPVEAANEVADGPVAQQRLFDPFAHPENSPSIRPPVNGAGAAVAAAAVPAARNTGAAVVDGASSPALAPAAAPAIAPAIAPTPRVKLEPKKEPAKPSAAPPPTQPHRLPIGVFAPRTMDPATISRRNWVGQQKTKFAHTPLWALAGAVGAVVVVIILVIYLAWPRHAATSSTRGAGGGYSVGLPPPRLNPRLERVSGGGLGTIAAPVGAGGLGLGQGIHPLETGPAPAAEAGKVYGPGEVPRTAELVYLVIATSPSEEVAQYNAAFLADHGVSVSIEKTKKGYYTIISVQGYPKQNDAAEAFRKNVVLEIGRQHRDYRKNKKDVWADAYYAKVTAAKP